MQQIGNTPPKQPMFNAPPVIPWLAFSLIGMHVFYIIGPEGFVTELMLYLVFNPSDLDLYASFPVELTTRWVGHAFVHAGWMHLLVNCGFLLAFGTPIARQIPLGSFLALFAGGAVGGALLVVAIDGFANFSYVGASGAISAFMGVYARMVFLRRGTEVAPGLFQERSRALIFVAIFIGTNLLINFLPGPGGTAISGTGHLGGFFAGIVLSVILPWARYRGAANDY